MIQSKKHTSPLPLSFEKVRDLDKTYFSSKIFEKCIGYDPIAQQKNLELGLNRILQGDMTAEPHPHWDTKGQRSYMLYVMGDASKDYEIKFFANMSDELKAYARWLFDQRNEEKTIEYELCRKKFLNGINQYIDSLLEETYKTRPQARTAKRIERKKLDTPRKRPATIREYKDDDWERLFNDEWEEDKTPIRLPPVRSLEHTLQTQPQLLSQVAQGMQYLRILTGDGYKAILFLDESTKDYNIEEILKLVKK